MLSQFLALLPRNVDGVSSDKGSLLSSPSMVRKQCRRIYRSSFSYLMSSSLMNQEPISDTTC